MVAGPLRRGRDDTPHQPQAVDETADDIGSPLQMRSGRPGQQTPRIPGRDLRLQPRQVSWSMRSATFWANDLQSIWEALGTALRSTKSSRLE